MMNAAANTLENVLRKGDGQADIRTDVANPASNPEQFADPSREKMKALTWQGANRVQLGALSQEDMHVHANLCSRLAQAQDSQR